MTEEIRTCFAGPLTALLLLTLAALAWVLYRLRRLAALLAEVRDHAVDTRLVIQARSEALAGWLSALREEVRRGPRLTHLPGPPGEEEP